MLWYKCLCAYKICDTALSQIVTQPTTHLLLYNHTKDYGWMQHNGIYGHSECESWQQCIFISCYFSFSFISFSFTSFWFDLSFSLREGNKIFMKALWPYTIIHEAYNVWYNSNFDTVQGVLSTYYILNVVVSWQYCKGLHI